MTILPVPRLTPTPPPMPMFRARQSRDVVHTRARHALPAPCYDVPRTLYVIPPPLPVQMFVSAPGRSLAAMRRERGVPVRLLLVREICAQPRDVLV